MITVSIYLSIITFIAVVVMVICTIWIFQKIKDMDEESHRDLTPDVELLKVLSDFDFDRIDTRIDKYINEAGDKYKLNHFEYKEPDELYLTEDMMNDMIKSIVREVRSRITPAILSLLTVSYNIPTEEDLIAFLYERVRMYVLNYSLETNEEI